MRLPATSLISTTPGVTRSASNIDFTHLRALPTPKPQVARLSNQNPCNHARMGSARHIKTVPPYPLNLTPTLSDLRPHCAAKDRLEMWLPHPNSLTFLSPPETLELQGRVKAVTLKGWAESTRTTYGAGLLIYHVFCDIREIPEKDCAPAKAALVSSFISALAGSLSGKAIQNYVYSMQAWHTAYGLPWALHKDQIATMLKGAMKLAPPTVRQNKRKPITIQMLSLIKDKLDQTSPFDMAFFMCLTTIFYTAVRVGKFTLPRLDAFNPTEHITCGSVCDDIDRNSLHTKVFPLPRTKSSPTGKEVHWAKQIGPTDPSDACNRHIKINDPPAGGPLFAYKTAKGYRPMTRQTFIARLNKFAQAANLHWSHAGVSSSRGPFRRYESKRSLGKQRLSTLPKEAQPDISSIHAVHATRNRPGVHQNRHATSPLVIFP